jgi:hypothetical protein
MEQEVMVLPESSTISQIFSQIKKYLSHKDVQVSIDTDQNKITKEPKQ